MNYKRIISAVLAIFVSITLVIVPSRANAAVISDGMNFGYIYDLEVDQNNNLYALSDDGVQGLDIKKFNVATKEVNDLYTELNYYGGYTPTATVDTYGNIYLLKYGNNSLVSSGINVKKISPSGGVLRDITLNSSMNGMYGSNDNIAVDGDGNIYILADNIIKIDSAGKSTNIMIGSDFYPQSIINDKNGNVYLFGMDSLGGLNYKFKKINASGEVVSYLDNIKVQYNGGIAVDNLGNLYITNYISGQDWHFDVVKIDPSGEMTTVQTLAQNEYVYKLATDNIGNIYGVQNGTVLVKLQSETYTIAAIEDQSAAVLTEGYTSGTQETKMISITNTGNNDLMNLSTTLSGTNANDFEITQPLTKTLSSEVLPLGFSVQTQGYSEEPTTTFTIQAKDGLVAGTYTATVTVLADNMKDVTFTITQVVGLPNAPESPQNLVAARGDRQVILNWDTVTAATYYNVYMSTIPGQFSKTPIATVTDTTYNVQNLTNGTTYYFLTESANTGGDSTSSNEVSAMPATISAAPTNVVATAGNGQATLSFAAPIDNGGSPITGYEVNVSPGNVVMATTESPMIITGLTNGTTYTFTVRAINNVGKSIDSAMTAAVTPSAPAVLPTPTPTIVTQPSATPTPVITTSGVDVLVNGKVENAGTATTTTVNNQTITTVAIDQKKLEDKLAAEGQGAVVTIPVNSKSDVVIGELNGEMLKNMEIKQAVLEIKTDKATYTLPAKQIDIDSLSNQLGNSVALQDIKIQIEIAVPTADRLKLVDAAATKGAFTLVAPSIEFNVKGVYGDKTIEVSKFNAYVERSIAIPDGVDPNKITTGIVVEPDGTVRQVPTKVVLIEGKYYAVINSLTNSTYSVVWHPLEFSDVEQHWAKNAINDMGSRMVIQGTGNDMYSPDQDITRAEFAAIVVRGLGLKLDNGANIFSDVKETDWYSSAIHTASSYNLISGYEDGTFHPNDKITREQAMVIIAKAMVITELKAKLPAQAAAETLLPYSDAADASKWAQSSITDCLQSGVVTGRNGSSLAPKAFITRAEVAAIVQRLLKKSELI